MEPAETVFVIILAAVNLAVGFGFSVPIAKLLRRLTGQRTKCFRYFAALVGIYFVECVAFAAGMATQVFSIGLAFVWGIAFGRWLRERATAREVVRTGLLVALYTSAPTASFGVLLLLGKLVEGSNLISIDQAIAFGIPHFVPWPLNTILGFCTALVIGTVALKTVITAGEISLLIHLGGKPAPERSQTNS
jgi:hypothetical protein